MRIGIIGTGAVGGFFGAKLKLAGFDVVFLARGKNLEIMKTEGLTLKTSGGIHKIKDVIFTDKVEELGLLDYILFTVKSYDTKTTAEQIKSIVTDKTTVITPQNGINNDLIIGEIIGKDKVLPAMAQVGVSTPRPGFIKHVSLGKLTFGEYNGDYSKRVSDFELILRKTGIEVIIANNIQLARWKKYIWNCTFNIIAGITGLSLDKILADSYLKDLCKKTILEIKFIAEKEGIILDEKDVVETRIKMAEAMGSFKPSTLEDLEKGKRIELDAFTGTIIELAKKHNMQVPINTILYALLHGKQAKI
ncbi:MAG: 2-dehydropantoate 2-reductase [Candidatus Roizmanbacteria bacterium GW2011_GWA2_35_8]|uniref:2-dehydropantoate 2-reductase n=1 Tax=Candidatus Roizmanbacteria bacterium GW2011_GWA2_35_8 TaxID=1618479 RepID=A0A0G0D1T6_9BACT|nr:MAG: 2-dehydropantoate 2-reductase [Candidatus Roizmanbacteria bacterium GW2011_GWA2_35_8]